MSDSFTGEWSHHDYIDANVIHVFDSEASGYIMIYRPRYWWFPEKLGRWFPKLMTFDAYPVEAVPTTNPDVLKLVSREEEE
jgi:hypothetical protein